MNGKKVLGKAPVTFNFGIGLKIVSFAADFIHMTCPCFFAEQVWNAEFLNFLIDTLTGNPNVLCNDCS